MATPEKRSQVIAQADAARAERACAGARRFLTTLTGELQALQQRGKLPADPALRDLALTLAALAAPGEVVRGPGRWPGLESVPVTYVQGKD